MPMVNRHTFKDLSRYLRIKRRVNKPTLCTYLKSASVALSDNNLTATGRSIGYRTILATQGLRRGKMYFEVEVASSKGAVRIGIATPSVEVNGPVGMNAEGYSYGSKNGYAFHMARRKRYGPSYGYRDIIGVLLVLETNSPVSCEKKCCTDRGISYVKFSKNGTSLGVAYEDLKEAEFRPAISLYGGSAATFNFGPYFAFPDQEIDDF